MDRLWAPWRMEFISKGEEKKCFLCNASADTKNDKEHLVVKRGKLVFAIMNRFPYNNGHLLISPNRHVGLLEELTQEELLEIMNLSVEMKKKLDNAFKPDGYNMGINLGRVAGAGLPGHFHLHIVPRWNGDTNFMPVLGETKVMPEYLQKTYEKIVK